MELFGRRKPKDVEAEVERLCEYLYNAGCWRTRSDICAALFMDERAMRECGEASDGRIIFGQRGMKHIRRATPEEVRECINNLYSRAAKQMERAKAIERLFHKYGYTPQEAMA